MSKIIEITDSEFESEVLKAKGPVLAYFWAAWCGPCRLTSPSINKIAEEYGDRLKVVKFQLKENDQSNAVKNCEVEGVPALRLFKEGETILSHEGAITKDKIKEKLDPHL